ncbi:MAG: DUF3575 domain-containing protein [Candidatus Saccharimonadaceae bacterium]
MKKITAILSIFILTSMFCLKAQDNDVLTNRHELKLNLGSSVFLAFPEVSYEYILSEDMSVGAAVGFGFDTQDSDAYSFRATPFLRWFFSRSQQPATGFFLEANSAVGSQDSYVYKSTSGNTSDWENKSTFTAGLGLAIGWKYLSKNNWTGELFGGLGRNFVYDKNNEDVSLYPRIGVSIGKRF